MFQKTSLLSSQNSCLNKFSVCHKLRASRPLPAKLVTRTRTLCRPIICCSEGASEVKGTQPALYGRERELGKLKLLAEQKPTCIHVIVGPPSSGRTAIFTQLRADSAAEGLEIIYLDCRLDDVHTPTAFAAALLEATSESQQLAERVKQFLLQAGTVTKRECEEVSFKGAVLEKIMDNMEERRSSPLAQIIQVYRDAASQMSASGKSPLIIVDEANILSSWADEHSLEQQMLLNFFVVITKQQNAAHVVLVTSDFSWLTWLKERIGRGFHQVRVIGNSPADEAKEFFNHTRKSQNLPEVDDGLWPQIYEVCGGNAGLLMQVACSKDSLETALGMVEQPVARDVASGLKPGKDAGFTADHYWTAVCQIRQSPYNAVTAGHLEDLLGEGAAGREAVQAMVQANLLAVRPYSDWAEDVDEKAFGSSKEAIVVAPLPVDLFHMKRLKNPKESEAGGTTAKPALSPDGSAELKASVMDLQNVAKAIQELDRQLNEILIRDRRPRGWKKKVEQLQTQKEELLDVQAALLAQLPES